MDWSLITSNPLDIIQLVCIFWLGHKLVELLQVVSEIKGQVSVMRDEESDK